MLNVPIEINPVKLPDKKADQNFKSKLGKSESGVNLVLGESFDDGYCDLKLKVGNISANQMRDFLVTGKKYQLIDELCKLILPANLFYIIEYKIDPADSKFILSNEYQNTYLGINSFILGLIKDPVQNDLAWKKRIKCPL